MTTNEELLGKIAKLRGLLDEADDKIDALRERIVELIKDNESLTATEAQAIYDRDCSWRHISDRDTRIRELETENARLTAPETEPRVKQIARELKDLGVEV